MYDNGIIEMFIVVLWDLKFIVFSMFSRLQEIIHACTVQVCTVSQYIVYKNYLIYLF